MDNGDGNLFRYQTSGPVLGPEAYIGSVPEREYDEDENILSLIGPAPALTEDNVFTGPSGGDWHNASNWSLARAPGPSDNAYIRASANVSFSEPVEVASLVISNAAVLSCNFASGKIAVRDRNAGDTTSATDYSVKILGNLTLAGGKLYMGGNSQRGRSLLAVKGDLLLSGNSELAIYAGPTNGVRSSFRKGGARVAVGGTTRLERGAWIFPVSCRSTGNGVIFDLNDLYVADGAGFDAKGLGFYRSKYAPCSQDSGSWANDGQWAGSHLGKGSGGVPEYDFELAPFFPGSGGNSGNGGGAIRINARNVTLNGKLDARPNNGTTSGGGGSVWITCDTFVPGASAEILAQGMDSGRGGGGGGGIAVGLGLTKRQIAELYDRGGTSKILAGPLNEVINGYVSYNVSPGTGSFSGTGTEGKALAYVGLDRADSSTLQVLLDAQYDCAVASSPSPGLHTFAPGTVLTSISIPSPVVVSSDGTKRMSVTGYTIKYADGNFQSGVGNTVPSLKIRGSVVLSWHLSNTEYLTSASVIGDPNGRVYVGAIAGQGWTADNGQTVLSAATDSTEYEFQYWTGDVPYDNRYDNPLLLQVSGGRSVTAFFGKKVGGRYVSANADGSWFDASHWSPAGIPGTNDTAIVISPSTRRKTRIPQFAAVGDLVISNSYLTVAVTDSNLGSIAGEGAYNAPQASTDSSVRHIGMDIFGKLLVDKTGFFYAGGNGQSAWTKVAVSGNLNIESGRMILSAGAVITNEFDATCSVDGGHIPYSDLRELFRGGNRLTVGGNTVVASAGGIQIFNDYRSGAAVWMKLKDVEVRENGSIDAYEGGYNRFTVKSKTYTMCPGGVRLGDNKSAGSHGGRGGNLSNGSFQSANKVYGYANAPFYPGYANGAGGIRGGGSVRLDCESLLLNGKIKANGSSRNKGGSAGGAIWINAADIDIGPNASLEAKGGSGVSGVGSGGGGGRIAICQGLSDDEMESLFLTCGELSDGLSASSLADKYGERVSVAGGTGHANYQSGEEGSAVYILSPGNSKVLTVAAIPENIGLPNPGYGENTYDAGVEIAFKAPETVIVSADGRSRRVCSGYSITNFTGIVAESDSHEGNLTISEDSFLTWDYSRLQHRLSLTATPGGTITTNAIPCPGSDWQDAGGTISLTAVADEGFIFAGWTGELPYSLSAPATLELPLDRPREFKALFVPATHLTRVWTGDGDGTKWIDPANWIPEGIPGPGDNVVITNGAPVAAHCITIDVRSIYVGPLATLTVKPMGNFSTMERRVAESSETDLWPCSVYVAENAVVDGTLTLGGRHSLSRASLLVKSSLVIGETGRLCVFAGYVDALTYASHELWADGGAKVDVLGTMKLRSGALVTPWCEGLSGAPAVFNTRVLDVDEGASIDASAHGWFYTIIDNVYYARWPDYQIGNFYVGGSYGGKSGNGTSHGALSSPYGLATAPYMPGSSGGNGMNTGGGAIRINAEKVRLNGSLIADGKAGWSSSGGGSGGAIWVTCSYYSDSPSARISAKGGANAQGQAGGGGGRICITTGMSAERIADFYATGTTALRHSQVDLMTVTPSGVITAEIDASGGISSNPACNGGDGTALLILGPPRGTILFFK